MIFMLTDMIETKAHTTRDGVLNLSVNVGVCDADMAVTVLIRPISSGASADVDANGWPKGYFEQIAGSMPELERHAQGEFEERVPLE